MLFNTPPCSDGGRAYHVRTFIITLRIGKKDLYPSGLVKKSVVERVLVRCLGVIKVEVGELRLFGGSQAGLGAFAELVVLEAEGSMGGVCVRTTCLCVCGCV